MSRLGMWLACLVFLVGCSVPPSQSYPLTEQGAEQWLKARAGSKVTWKSLGIAGMMFSNQAVMASAIEDLRVEWPAGILIEEESWRKDLLTLGGNPIVDTNDLRCRKNVSDSTRKRKFCTNVILLWNSGMVYIYPDVSGIFYSTEPPK